jgi:uroporphyrin-III C-methyltransferase/precorrin-2 dehydrogenase/sirohydrochlorin ferrochelatase
VSDPARIGPLATLPLFHRIRGRKAVVAGSSAAAEWKAELLAGAGAHVVRLDDAWAEQEVAGAVIAVADLPTHEDRLRFVKSARRAGALVNIIDRPDLCDVTFGTIVNRSPVVIGISTDGAAPALGQSIRARIETVLPRGISKWAEQAKRWRPTLRARISDFNARREFWTRFVKEAWGHPNGGPSDEAFEALLARSGKTRGKVVLVGAGPGDPELLTLKAVQAFQTATVVLYDNLVSPEILELARREARRIPVGKSGRGPSCKQSDINHLLVELAEAGETVIRLKGGDPLIFGRATEEIDACREAGIEVSVVPGVSAAQGAAASLLVSLTERRHARRVQFVTGHGLDGKLPSDIDWLSVADRRATTILYMPRGTLDQFVRTALAKGLDPATPAIAVASTSLPNEQHAAGTIAEIGALAGSLPAGAPVTIIIGWVGRRHLRQEPAVVPFQRAFAS